jgi:hypothetical protein
MFKNVFIFVEMKNKMKKINFFVFFTLIMLSVKSQCFVTEKTPSAQLYYITKGVGMEVGEWTTEEKRITLFGGMMALIEDRIKYDPITKKDIKNEILVSVFYGRVQYRINRFVHLTSVVGLKDLNELYTSAGIRFCVPVHRGDKFAFIVDPQITNVGYKLGIGFIVAMY